MDLAENLLKIIPDKINAETSEVKKNGPRIVTIASGKGGVGKTNIAINLGIGFANMGKEVVVMDADLGLANVNVILGVVPKYNLLDVIKGEKRINDIILETNAGIKIVAGGSGIFQLADLNDDEKHKLIFELEELNFADIIIIDTGAGISSNVISFILAADDVIIVTTPEPTAMTDAYGIIKVISQKTEHCNIKLLINRVHSVQQAENVSNRVISIASKFLNTNVEYFGYVYNDEVIPKSVLKQKPFMIFDNKSKAAKCIENICLRFENVGLNYSQKGLKKFFKSLLKTNKNEILN